MSFIRDSSRRQGSLPFGAKKETAADIIAKSKREREERAKKKKEEESSIKIQAACRSYIVRRRQQAAWRQQYEADQSLDVVARLRLFLALHHTAQRALLASCVAHWLQHESEYRTALRDAPATRIYQARHLSKVILDVLKSRDARTNHVLGAEQLIALVDRLVQQEQERVARWLIDRADLFRTVHELCERYTDHVTALIDLAAHCYMTSASSDVAVSAQLWWHLLSSEHVTDTHVTHLIAAVTRALSVLARDPSHDSSRGVDFVALFRTHKLNLDQRGLLNAAQNGTLILRALAENTEHEESRAQLAHWLAVVEQCAALALHRKPVPQRARAEVDEDAMELEFTEPEVPPRDQLAEQSAAQICGVLLSERARDRGTVLATLARAVTSTTLDWHSATLSRLVALLLTHGTAHDTRRVSQEISEAYTAQWPALRQSEEFRRLLRDLTGQAVEHTAPSTSASTDVLLHTWLTLAVTHAQLARVDRSNLHVDIPLPLQTITRELCTSFQDKLVRLYWREDSAESAALVQLRGAVTRLLSLAHELSAVHAGVWPKNSALSAAQVHVLLEAYPLSFKRVMRHAPFLLDTKEKVALLQQWIRADKEVHQPFEQGQISHLQIRRTHLLQDVFNKLAPPGTSLKRTVKIEFINQEGLAEAGIDGGGLFRELVNEVIKTAFSPQYGLFKATEQQQLYPNPASPLLVENDTEKFRFLGRLLGKCIYELCLVDLPFTEFFLAQLLDRPVAVHQLKSLDAALYKGLTALRSYTGDFEDLELNFTLHEDERDIETAAVNLPVKHSAGRVVELIDQGSNVKVIRDNVEEYIALVAKYRMQTQISAQSRAFKEGLCDVIDREWLALLGWTESEFALLINGEQLVHGLDIAAMQQHVVYAGGYHAHHPVVLLFWEVLSEFTPDQQSMLLKYATSSPRPPLLGFGTLQPKFCIKLSSQDESYLPSANTCMNLLKLPAYHSKQLMRDKLLYAINSNSGFDLS